MKKQSGFTLIELLLVLAIIGIISAIAIPALLSQRARARDKAALENMTSRIADLAGQWDKGKEAGTASTTIITNMGTYLAQTAANDKNPWDNSTAAFNTTIQTATGATASAFATAIGTGAKGYTQFYIQTPTAGGGVGFLGGAVLLNASSNSDTPAYSKKRTKVVAIE